MKPPELSIEELRKIYYKDLSKFFDSPHYGLNNLSGGIIHFDTLTDPNKTIEEIEEESGLKESTIKTYIRTLRKAGYPVKKFETQRKRCKPTRKDEIKLLLKRNPSVYEKIIAESAKSGMSPKTVYNCVEELVREHEISFLPVKLGRHNKAHSLYPELGMTRGVKIFHLLGEEGLAAEIATEYLPQKEITPEMKKSLYLRSRKLPEDSSTIVKEHIKKLRVIKNNAN